MKNITLKRNRDHIDFINQNGVAIAFLFDHHDHIIFDPLADSHEIFGQDGKVDWPAFFEENSITVQSARMIDAMPSPSGSI